MKKNKLTISNILVAILMSFSWIAHSETISATSFYSLTHGYSSRACEYAISEAWDKAREKCGDENKQIIAYGSTCDFDALSFALSSTATVRFSCVDYGTARSSRY